MNKKIKLIYNYNLEEVKTYKKYDRIQIFQLHN